MEQRAWDPRVPSGSALPSSLPTYLGVLDPYVDRITMLAHVRGVIEGREIGDDHHWFGAMLTGRIPNNIGKGTNEMASGPSVDHVIAERHGQRSLVIGYQGRESEAPTKNFSSWAAANTGNPAILPQRAFDDLFGNGLPSSPGSTTTPDPQDEARRRRRSSVLDFVAGQITSTRQTLPQLDRYILDAHLDGIRDLERRLGDSSPGLGGATAGCGLPNDGNIDRGIDLSTGNYPELAELTNAVAVMAVRCDLRRSIVIQTTSGTNWFVTPRSIPNNKYHSFNVSNGENWHQVAHRGYNNERIELEKFHMNIFKETLDLLDEHRESGDSTHLDNSVCLWMRAMGHSNHSAGDTMLRERFALLVGGGGGRLRGNLFYDTGGDDDNDVLITCLQACGFDDTEFGDPSRCDGPYPVLNNV